jgi:hypothetical protein
MATHRRRDTFVNDCNSIFSSHVRRADGPMARSVYSQYINHAPRTARTPAATLAKTPHQSAAILYGHTLECPLARSKSTWYAEYTQPRIDHVAAGCTIVEPAALRQQLASIIGEHRLARAEGVFRGHSLDCPLVSVPRANERAVWSTERQRLEAGIAGVVVDDFSLATTLDVHRRAGCFASDAIDWTNDDALDALARSVISQIHAACRVPDVVARPLTLDDVVDYEARFLLDDIRAPDSGMSFAL